MERPARFMSALVALAAALAASGVTAADAQTQVLAQNLVKARSSAGVQAALWTRRQDSYTLQLVVSPWILNPVTSARAVNLVDGRRMVQPFPAIEAGAQVAKQPGTSVWLLRADGTQLLTRAPVVNPAPDKCFIRCYAVDVTYRFSIAEASQAVAVAIRIGDDFHVEKLEPLEQVRN